MITAMEIGGTFTPDDALLVGPRAGQFRLKDVFQAYVADINNWTLGREVSDLLPALKGKIQFR